jgi:hypothetical protein
VHIEKLSVTFAFVTASEAFDEGCFDVSLAFEHKRTEYSEC